LRCKLLRGEGYMSPKILHRAKQLLPKKTPDEILTIFPPIRSGDTHNGPPRGAHWTYVTSMGSEASSHRRQSAANGWEQDYTKQQRITVIQTEDGIKQK